MERIIIDRFEGDYAVMEFGEEMFDIPRDALPSNAKEGDVIELVISKFKKNNYEDLFEK